ncbi:hypothetical protein [Streptomyces sparsogenes]
MDLVLPHGRSAIAISGNAGNAGNADRTVSRFPGLLFIKGIPGFSTDMRK